MDINKYRLYCETEGTHKSVISDAAPTVCPTNAAHTVRADSVAIIESNILVRDGTALDVTLSDLKQLRYNEIDGKTLTLMKTFTYDNKSFSLSIDAQMNWNALKNNEADFSWPVSISTADNYEYSLSQSNLTAFWTAGRDAVKTALDGGRQLKKQIYDALDSAAVDAVVDTR
jgi:hypothetical protein